MAGCETTHWTLDCGEGHGCYLVEFSDTGELAGWGCSSELVKGRRRTRENDSTYIGGSATLEFCCHNITRAALAEALDDLVEPELMVPKGKHSERISYSVIATLGDIVRGVGLSLRT
jgi:hypothetical protein